MSHGFEGFVEGAHPAFLILRDRMLSFVEALAWSEFQCPRAGSLPRAGMRAEIEGETGRGQEFTGLGFRVLSLGGTMTV